MLTPGTLVESRYEVLAHVGTGVGTRSYLVRHIGLRSLHTLEVLEDATARDEAVRARFLAEGRLQAGLRHPHLVVATEVISATPFARVSDRVEGPSLRARLDRTRVPGTPGADPTSLAGTLELLLPVLDAVGAAHAGGLVHGCLTPDTIVLTADARGRVHPMVTGFGQVLPAAGPDAGRADPEALQYKSPEQLRERGEVGPPADLYAVGVMAYQLLTGHPPFDSDNVPDTVQDILAGRYWPPELLVPDLPPVVGAVLRRALALEPAGRFADAAAFRAALLDAAEQIDERATDPGAEPIPAARAPTPEAPATPPDDPTPSTATAPLAPPALDPPRPPREPGRVEPPSEASTHSPEPGPVEPGAPPPRGRRGVVIGALLTAAAILAVLAWRAAPDTAAPNTATPNGNPTTGATAALPIATRYPMVPVSPLQFTMGAPPDEPGRWKDEVPHAVTLTRPILFGAHEVDQALWAEVMGANPSTHVAPDHPVEGVSWLDAITFCNRLSALQGLAPAYVIAGTNITFDPDAAGYRLPTEAEWEAAARAGTTDPFGGSTVAEEVAWFAQTANGTTHPVGARKPNALGLYDMSGNVSEWAWDWYGDYPVAALTTDPTGPTAGESRIHRGGSWDANERAQRVAYRRAALPGTRSASIGLRLVRLTPATPADR